MKAVQIPNCEKIVSIALWSPPRIPPLAKEGNVIKAPWLQFTLSHTERYLSHEIKKGGLFVKSKEI